MNKFFVFALFALVAACAAAPTEEPTINPVTETETGTIEHDAEKRAILYRAPIGAYYPGYHGYTGYTGYPGVGVSNYRYRYASPASALSYLSYPSSKYYGSYII